MTDHKPYEGLRKLLRKLQDRASRYQCAESLESLQEIEDEINDFPFGPIPHWIKCSERLPQEGKRVLVFSDYVQCKIYEKEYGFYDGTTHCFCPEGRLDEVTHWMPLPGPPNE